LQPSRGIRAASSQACWRWWWPRPAQRRLWGPRSAMRWHSRLPSPLRLHGAGAGAGCALCGAHPAAGVDARAAQTRRVDGGAAAGHLCADFHHGDLAGVGVGAGLWRKRVGGASGKLPAAGDCGWFLGRWPAQRWAALVAAAILLAAVLVSVFAPGKLAVAPETLGAQEATELWQPWSQGAVTRSLGAGSQSSSTSPRAGALAARSTSVLRSAGQRSFRPSKPGTSFAEGRLDSPRRSYHPGAYALDRSGVPAYALYTPGRRPADAA